MSRYALNIIIFDLFRFNNTLVDFIVNKILKSPRFYLTFSLRVIIITIIDFCVNKEREVENTKKRENALYGVKEARKREIALAGLKVFCEKGYSGATIEDIVKKAGCSHGLFYYYFKNKKEVFDETMRIKHEKSNGDMEKSLAKTFDYNEKLRIIINGMFYDLKNDENFAYFYYFFVSQCFTGKETGTPPPPPPTADGSKPELPVVKLERLFSEGQKAGYFTVKHSAAECARLFISIIQGATLGYVIAPKEIQKQMTLPDVDFIIDVFKKENI